MFVPFYHIAIKTHLLPKSEPPNPKSEPKSKLPKPEPPKKSFLISRPLEWFDLLLERLSKNKMIFGVVIIVINSAFLTYFFVVVQYTIMQYYSNH